jgi:hypothetical protein
MSAIGGLSRRVEYKHDEKPSVRLQAGLRLIRKLNLNVKSPSNKHYTYMNHATEILPWLPDSFIISNTCGQQHQQAG